MATNQIIIGLDRLPTLVVLGKEYPYDVTSKSVLDKLQSITADSIDEETRSIDTVVQLYKDFIQTVFCDSAEVVERIAEVYTDRLQLWADAAIQVAGFVRNPKYSGILDRLGELRKAADEK